MTHQERDHLRHLIDQKRRRRLEQAKPRDAKRPWWWLLAAPIFIAKGLYGFLRHGPGA